MKDTFDEGEEGWKQKEIEYVTSRDQWVTDVRNGKMEMIASDTETMRQELESFSKSLGNKTNGFTTSQQSLMETFTPIVQIPQWMSDYEILAETTFGALKKAVFSDALIEQSIDSLEATVAEFEDKKMMMELDKLYHDLEVAHDQVMGKIEAISEGNQDMVEDMMFKDGFSVRGGSYYKKALYKYSLFEGERFRDVYLPYFKEYAFTQEVSAYFTLPDRETFLASSDIDEKKIEVYRQIASMKSAARTILGTKNKPGTLYTKHVGRMATGEEIQKYSEQRKKSEPKGWLESFIGALLSPLNWVMQGLTEVLKAVGSLFIPEDGEDPNAGLEEFQKALIRDVPDSKNRGLETGRIMLNYQYHDMMETQAIAARDGGILNAPLFDGGPSLASVGNIALSIATGGTNLLANLAYTAGTGLVNYATATDQFKDQIANSTISGMLTTLAGAGMSSATGALKEGLSLGKDIGSLALNAAIDTASAFVTNTVSSAVNAMDWTTGKFNGNAFDQSFRQSNLSLIGTFAGSFAQNGLAVLGGATWDNGGYNFKLLNDTATSTSVLDYYNTSMKRSSSFWGGLLEQGINIATGASTGFTFNVLNAQDFGFKNSTGLLAVSFGSSGAVTQISQSGLNVSASMFKDMMKGNKAIEDKNTIEKLSANDPRRLAYVAANLALYSGQSEDSSYVTMLQRIIDGDTSITLDISGEVNAQNGSVLTFDKTLFEGLGVDENGITTWDLSKAAKFTSIAGHESYHYTNNPNGSAAIDPEIAEKAQEIIKKNSHLSKVAQKELLEKELGIDAASEYFEDIDAHTFDTQIWGNLKKMFKIKDFEMDNKLTQYMSGDGNFLRYLNGFYNLGKNSSDYLGAGAEGVTNYIKFLQDIENSNGTMTNEMKAQLSVYLGFQKEGQEALALVSELYNKTDILNSSINNINLMLQRGYELKRNADGKIEASNVSVANNLGMLRDMIAQESAELQKVVKPLLDQLPDADIINIITQFNKGTKPEEAAAIVQRYIYDRKGQQEVARLRDVGILTGKTAVVDKKVAAIKTALDDQKTTIKNEMKQILADWTENVFKKARNDSRLVTGHGEDKENPNWPREGIVKFDNPALCNIGTANYMAMLGYEEYLYNGKDYNGVKQVVDPADPKTTANATTLINAIDKDKDNFSNLNNLLDWGAFKDMCGGDGTKMMSTLNTIFKLLDTAGYGVIGTMLANSGSSHIFFYNGGKSYDINYSKGTEKQEPIYGKNIFGKTTKKIVGYDPYWEADYTSVSLYDSWGKTPATLLSKLMEYGSMDKETWIQNYMKEKNVTEQNALEQYKKNTKIGNQNYEFGFYITNYSIMATMDLDNIWGTQDFDSWLKNNP